MDSGGTYGILLHAIDEIHDGITYGDGWMKQAESDRCQATGVMW
jgi:hypothetical protein